LTIAVDGQSKTFAYNTGAGGNADTIDDFITNFNAGHYGVTASFDATAQKIVFARDPTNEDLALRGNQQNNPETPSFTITDSNFNARTPATSLLGALGASGINGVTQDATNAYAASDDGVANALVTMFGGNAGVPALEMQSAAAATAGTPATVALPAGVGDVRVGQVLTIDAQQGGGAPQENVVVTATGMNPSTGTSRSHSRRSTTTRQIIRSLPRRRRRCSSSTAGSSRSSASTRRPPRPETRRRRRSLRTSTASGRAFPASTSTKRHRISSSTRTRTPPPRGRSVRSTRSWAP
jgi:hypothetical protein